MNPNENPQQPNINPPQEPQVQPQQYVDQTTQPQQPAVYAQPGVQQPAVYGPPQQAAPQPMQQPPQQYAMPAMQPASMPSQSKIPTKLILIIVAVVIVIVVVILAVVLMKSSKSDNSTGNTGSGSVLKENADSKTISLKKGMSKADAEKALGGIEATCTPIGANEVCVYKDGASISDSSIIASISYESGSLKSASVVQGDKETVSIK